MRTHSIYELPCPCGRVVESEGKITICPACKRVLEAQWPADYKVPEVKK